MKPGRDSLLPLLVMGGVVVADQLSKWLVRLLLPLHESREVVPGFFNLTHLTNTGVAFGLLAGRPGPARQAFFLLVAMVALVVLFLTYLHLRHQGWLFRLAIGLIAGGALGNLIDRLRLGAVTDFLDFSLGGHHWPAFNLADSAITVGAGLFILGSMLADAETENEQQ